MVKRPLMFQKIIKSKIKMIWLASASEWAHELDCLFNVLVGQHPPIWIRSPEGGPPPHEITPPHQSPLHTNTPLWKKKVKTRTSPNFLHQGQTSYNTTIGCLTGTKPLFTHIHGGPHITQTLHPTVDTLFEDHKTHPPPLSCTLLVLHTRTHGENVIPAPSCC